MCESVGILMSFTLFYCTSFIALLYFTYTVYLSVCFSFVCLWATLSDSNKLMMMISWRDLTIMQEVISRPHSLAFNAVC